MTNEVSAAINHEAFRAAKVLSIATMAVMLTFYFSGLDYLFAKERHLELLIIRIVAALVCLANFIIAGFPKFEKHSRIIVAIPILAGGWSVAVMMRILGYESTYYAGFIVAYVGALFSPYGVRWVLTVCGLIYLSYIVPILLFDRANLNIVVFINNNQFQIFTFAVVAMVNQFKYSAAKREIINRLTVEHQKRDIEERERDKNQFIANVSHELKTPLSIVIGYADILLEQLKPEDTQSVKLAHMIQQGAFQLANHVDRFVNISQADNPDMRLVIDKYNYIGVVQGVCSLFEARAKDENKAFGFEAPHDRLVVSMDVAKIEESLNNLIQNAFKYTKSGDSITVRVTADTDNVYTEVIDSGAGIAEEKQSRIFDRLFQADEVLSKSHAGMGIGLYLVKRNVTAHIGDVSVVSQLGYGTTLRFFLPLHVDQSADVRNASYDGSDRRETPRRSGSDRRADERRRRFEYQQNMGVDALAQMADIQNLAEYENHSPGSPAVLVVEDNPAMMKVVVDALGSDHNLFLARNARSALEKLTLHDKIISLILTDVMMPEMNGFEFCEKVMVQENLKHIPLIFVSALMTQTDQLRGFSLGATDYIVKPYNVKILREKVSHWISRRQYEQIILRMSVALEARAVELARLKDVMVHEIRNPLQVVESAEFFLKQLRAEFYHNSTPELKGCWESLQSLQNASIAIKSIMDLTSDLERSGLPDRHEIPVSALFDDARRLVQHLLGGVALEVHTTTAEGFSLQCDIKMLTQVFVNVIRNAVEAIVEQHPAGGGRIIVEAKKCRGSQIEVIIRDNGIGMSEEVIGSLFRFRFTTKKDGTGIGLHFSRMICKLHGGDITVSSKPGNGATFSIYLPIVQSVPARAS